MKTRDALQKLSALLFALIVFLFPQPLLANLGSGGDVRTEKPIVTVAGQVRVVGNVVITPGMSLLDLISKMDGFTDGADKSAVKITRQSHGGNGQRFTVDCSSEGAAREFRLEGGDIVYVPSRGLK